MYFTSSKMLVAFEFFSVMFRKQNVAHSWKREKKRDKFKGEKTLFFWYETSFSKLTKGLE